MDSVKAGLIRILEQGSILWEYHKLDTYNISQWMSNKLLVVPPELIIEPRVKRPRIEPEA